MVYSDYIEFEDGEIEFFTFDEPYEKYEDIIAELKRDTLDWRYRGNCLDRNMYPNRISKQEELAQTLCVNCEVQVTCLYTALVCREEYGVWGGTTEQVRGELIAQLTMGLGNYAKLWTDESGKEIMDTAEQYVKIHNVKHTKQITAE
jgi:hypothetical protein